MRHKLRHLLRRDHCFDDEHLVLLEHFLDRTELPFLCEGRDVHLEICQITETSREGRQSAQLVDSEILEVNWNSCFLLLLWALALLSLPHPFLFLLLELSVARS